MRVHFIQHVSFENPGNLLHWAKREQHEISFTIIDEEPIFPGTGSFDLLVIMGGPMGVYEEDQYDWLKPEKVFIKSAIDAKKKVLGICLGSQLVAEALGSKVYPHTEKEIGWWPVQKKKSREADLLTNNLPESFVSFHWHGDTFDLPPGAVQLFSTDVCPQQGYMWGNNVAAIQFHPEVTKELAEAMIGHGKSELIDAPYIQTAEEMKKAIADHVPAQEDYMSCFVNRFLQL